MNASTTREPFTKPFTGSEMRLIQQRISDAVRARTKPRSGVPLPLTHEQMVKEVEDAIAFSESRTAKAARRRARYAEVAAVRRGAFPPLYHVPSAALSAVVTP